MSETPKVYLDNPDALSSLVAGLALKAEIYVDGDFCGAWAVDTSGSRKIPFHLIGRGEAWLHMEGRAPQQLSPGDLLLFPRDDMHLISSSSTLPTRDNINQVPAIVPGEAITNMVCGSFEFENKLAWPLLDSLSSVVFLDLSECSTAPYVKQYIDLILGELRRKRPGYYAVVNQLAYLLFVEVLRQQIESNKIRTGLLPALFDSKISRALQAIHNRPSEHWTLEKLAREAIMGRSSFAERFNKLVGMPAMQYLVNWRMQEARLLLQTTSVSMADIADRCGYESEAAFRKTFKKVIGQPPGAVRRSAEKLV